ncbi:MAG: HEAT repeat domain-containing protein [Planctomycetes bacterium]|nr:HEAT repeat domain-containing protein [Planctomycetota bacterium]MCH9726206.1 HEAT repeat domain-containing protein [Planctomycetota bacterium]MCH9775711.1 HEAT repeat domain-containing protein [Planctomycetota bacterium]MCH9792058.1 HEAT repeat domain-containing protein [Planctomycetota bacterium]
MSQYEEYSWVTIRKFLFVTCLVLITIYLSIYISWRVYQYRAVRELVHAIESFNDQETLESLNKVKSRDATEQALSRLIELLESNSKAADSRAIRRAFSGIGSQAISRLLEKTDPSENLNTRLKAIFVLREMADSQLDAYEIQRIVHSLLQALNDENREIRFSAAQVILMFGASESDEILPIFVEVLLKDPDPENRWNAALRIGILGELGAQVDTVLADLQQALNDPVAIVRIHAAHAIYKIGIPDQVMIDAFIEMLFDENLSCRREAATLLGQLEGRAKSAVPALLESLNMLKDVKQEMARRSLVDALGDIGHASPDVVQALVDTLNNKRFGYSREHAAFSLGKLGPKAVSAVPDLVKVRDELKINSKLYSETNMEMEFENRLGLVAAIALKQIDPKKFNRALDGSNTKAQ